MVEVATYKLTKPSSKKKESKTLVVLEERCKGCNFCIEFCPQGCLEQSRFFNKKGYHPPRLAYKDKCGGCGICELLCPEFGIYLKSQ